MSKGIKVFMIPFLAIFIFLSIPNIGDANSAEPPSILIIVPYGPEDLEIRMGSKDTLIDAKKTDKIIDKYYTFYYRDLQMISDLTLHITTGDINYTLSLDKQPQYYNNIYTLDLDARTLAQGKLLSRSILLVSLRIILTLLIEGLVFWQFGFRNKSSWKSFFIINLITQGALNLWINTFSPLVSYLFFSLIFGEIIIFIVETFLFLFFTREQARSTTISYVLFANILSLIVGGYMITILPI